VLHRIIIISSILLLFNSCEQLVNTGGLSSSEKYPTNLGHEWEYNTIWKFEFYDSTGHIDSTSIEDLGNTIVKVTKEQETLETYTNLIRFEDYDVTTPQNINRMWYLNADSGFYAIAYHNPGVSQPVIPKQGILTTEQIKSFVKSFRVFPSDAELNPQSHHVTDSIQYYSPARKVLKYPLGIGARWIELIEPFYRERFINKQQIVNAIGKNYYCYKIELELFWGNFKLNDYLDMNSGLIIREIIADSVSHILPGSPDIVGYYKSTTISTLVREKK
jgi:hypothetical protein